MPILRVRRTGRSLGLSLPRALVEKMDLSPGDEVRVELVKLPAYLALAGRLRGKITADTFTRLSNEGEHLA